jgi:hypothetical protein
MSDEVDHLALPLNAALHSDHALATITMQRNFTSLFALTGRSATVVR